MSDLNALSRPSDSSTPLQMASDELFDLKEVFLFFRRRLRLITFVALIVGFVGVLLSYLQTPGYTSEVVLQIQSQDSKLVDIESVVTGTYSERTAIQSEVDIIKSREVTGRVVDELDLVNNEEFSPQGGRSLLGTVKSFLSSPKEEGDPEAIKYRHRQITVSNVARNFSVSSSPRSKTIKLRFTSASPQLAAQIANAYADAYLSYQMETKFEATQRANKWLSTRLDELRRSVGESEQAVQEFRESNNLLEKRGVTITDQQLSELNTQLVLARTSRAESEARLRTVKNLLKDGKGIDSAPEVLDSTLIQNLRTQETEVSRKEADLASRYGDKHPKMINVRAELKDLRAKIDSEIRKIVEGMKNDLNIAKTREKALEDNLNQTKGLVGVSSRAEVELAELEREMNANRNLYENFLSRYKETSQNQDLQKSESQIISRAEAPLLPSHPNKKMWLLVSLFIGFTLGTSIAFAVERLEPGFHSTEQLEKFSGMPVLGIVPLVPRKVDPVSYAISHLVSRYSEALRTIYTSMNFSSVIDKKQVFVVTSSAPEEGKSSFTVSLGRLLAKSGLKVLVIDCDMRRPAVAKYLGQDIERGLSCYLENQVSDGIVQHDKESGLYFIGCHPNQLNSQQLLTSEKMEKLISHVRTKYDVILLDTPPVNAVADSIILSRLADGVVMAVRWHKTPREFVKNAFKRLKSCHVPLIGTVMTCVDEDVTMKYGDGDYYHHYKNYYVN